jgi:hypothetical protein
VALDAHERDARPGPPRAHAGGDHLALDLDQPRRRAVDLEHLLPGVLDDELLRRAHRDGLAVRHDRHRVGEPLRLLDVVRRHEDRGAFAAQRVDQRPQLLAHLRVQADRRLVEQQQPRAVDEPARDQQPPPHAARQLVDLRRAPVGEVGDLERALDRRPALGPAEPVEVGEDAQVLLDGQRRVEVVELRHDAHLGPRDLRLLGQPVAQDLELAGVRDDLRGQHLHRRRLARAVGAEQADAAPGGDVEIEAVDGDDVAEALDDRAQADREVAGDLELALWCGHR